MSKFHGDVRPLSHDTRYMGDPFVGTMDDAILQARGAPEYAPEPIQFSAELYEMGLISRDRYRLLQHLNLLKI